MRESAINVGGFTLPLFSVNTLVVGSGAAGLSCALNLHQQGIDDVLIVTEELKGGTSFKSGSDKQTYYKLSLDGSVNDSPLKMAGDLFDGKGMHGDIALCEAQHSLQSFYNLVGLGVPFPHDCYGAYTGYRTDHDQMSRATSAGPLTSRLMGEALLKALKNTKIPVFDQFQVISLLTEKKDEKNYVYGALALNKACPDEKNYGLVVFNARNIVLATGGPGGLYQSTVYPENQIGSIGLALKIGAVAHNLTESQFGIASTDFRWNLSGTYQQVIPCYYSTNMDGGDRKEFLNEYFPDMTLLTRAIFLKGYQWPFDPDKIPDYGSSLIDLAVHIERTVRKRRVFLDYRVNPSGIGQFGEFNFDLLESEVRDYLQKSNALLKSPIQRLTRMNPDAIKLFKDNGIDITCDPLEIAVCAQHNNGGLKSNIWWQSNIKNLFPIGEVNGSHGVYRPGGSALNAGQVGALRSAMYIAAKYSTPPVLDSEFEDLGCKKIEMCLNEIKSVIGDPENDGNRLDDSLQKIRKCMTAEAAHVRNPSNIKNILESTEHLYRDITTFPLISSSRKLPQALKLIELCLTQMFYLTALKEYFDKGGGSRGSVMVLDPNGKLPCPGLEDKWKCRNHLDNTFINENILELSYLNGVIIKSWTRIRAIPENKLWFENLWRDYDKGIIFDQGEIE